MTFESASVCEMQDERKNAFNDQACTQTRQFSHQVPTNMFRLERIPLVGILSLPCRDQVEGNTKTLLSEQSLVSSIAREVLLRSASEMVYKPTEVAS